MTRGYRLPARHVIHAVGPVWRGGDEGEAELLSSAYRRSLELAVEHELAHIAFSAISTGVYGYPLEAAAQVAVDVVVGHLAAHEWPRRVTLCTFDARATAAFQRALARRLSAG
jgi:O-acetyl-ADP-ribose deacetylase (regulator of RNase III)